MDAGKDISIIYVTCDKYSDLWEGYFKLFRRYWPDCPFRIYLLANSSGMGVEGIPTLAVGEDVSWSDNLLSALARITTPYVFLLPDDFLLVDRVPNDWVVEKMAWAVARGVSYLRFCPDPPRPVEKVDGDIGVIPKGSLYRTSLRFTLWNIEILKRLLKAGESAWEFELAGSTRSDLFDDFYGIYGEPFKFVNGVIKGRWNPLAVRIARRHGAHFELSKRQMMSKGACVCEGVKILRSRVLLLVPYRLRRTVRSGVLGFFGR